jgi:hypothetical protein
MDSTEHRLYIKLKVTTLFRLFYAKIEMLLELLLKSFHQTNEQK